MNAGEDSAQDGAEAGPDALAEGNYGLDGALALPASVRSLPSPLPGSFRSIPADIKLIQQPRLVSCIACADCWGSGVAHQTERGGIVLPLCPTLTPPLQCCMSQSWNQLICSNWLVCTKILGFQCAWRNINSHAGMGSSIFSSVHLFAGSSR